MIIFFIYYIREGLNYVKNNLSYNLLIDFNTRVKGCDVKIKIKMIRARVI